MLFHDMRATVHGLADEGSVLELRRGFGAGMITALIRVEGRPLGLIANDPRHISPAIVNRLYRDANDVSATLDVRNVIRRSRLMMYGGAALASLLLFAGVLKWGPREISQGVAQLVTPTTLAASTNAMAPK